MQDQSGEENKPEREERLRALHESLIQWNDRASNRASILLATNGALLFALSLAAPSKPWWSAASTTDPWLTSLLSTIGWLSLLLSFTIVLISYLPRTSSANDSILYFGSISEKNLDDFKTQFLTISDEEIFDDLSAQVHHNALVCNRKFFLLKLATVSQIVALLSLISMVLITNELF